MKSMQIRPKAHTITILISFFLALVAALVIVYGTSWGPWAYSDGVGYLVIARNFVQGVGLGLILPSGSFEPLVSHPPLYPGLLGLLSLLQFDLFTAARLIDSFSFVVFTLLSGYLLLRITSDHLVSISYTALLFTAPGLVLIFLSAMAEPLFFAFGYPGLLLFALYLQRDRPDLRTASALMIGAAVASRYPAVSMVAASIVALILVKGLNRKAVLSSVVFSGVALLPTAIFLIWSRLATGSASPRAIATVESSASLASFLRQFLSVIWSWKPLPPAAAIRALLGSGTSQWLPIIVASLLIFGLSLMIPWRILLRKQSSSLRLLENKFPRPLALVLVSFIVSYVSLLLAAYFGTYPTPDVDFRTLLPLLPALLLLAVLGLNSLRKLGGDRPVHTFGFVVIIGAAVLGYGISTAELVAGHHRTGAGYTSRAWQQSTTIANLSQLPTDLPLVSNHPEAILLYADRYPHDLKALVNAPNQLPKFCPEALMSLIQDQRAMVVLFDLTGDPSQRNLDYQDTKQFLQNECPLEIIQEFRDGIFLGASAVQSRYSNLAHAKHAQIQVR